MAEYDALQKAINVIGSATKLAKGLQITKGAVSQWRARHVPAEHCPSIERLTDGRVRCEELRPDVDWSVLRQSISKRRRS